MEKKQEHDASSTSNETLPCLRTEKYEDLNYSGT